VDEIKQTIATYAARSVEQRRHCYSPAAAAYAATRPRYLQQLVDAVVARSGLTPASTLLEVGCGPGTATVSFAELGCRIVAIEPNPVFCLLAKEACLSCVKPLGGAQGSSASSSTTPRSPAWWGRYCWTRTSTGNWRAAA
jgi:hypothetical protein